MFWRLLFGYFNSVSALRAFCPFAGVFCWYFDFFSAGTFETDEVNLHFVPGDYPTIQKAIDAASPYDEVVVATGTHLITNPQGIDFGGKPLTLRSEYPDDAEKVAATIIDCRGNPEDL
jgi:hypothetical protein